MFRASTVVELTRRLWARDVAAAPLEQKAGAEPRAEVVELALATKGFLDLEEGEALFRLALEAGRIGPCLEIGSYCGRSTLFLGEGCRLSGRHPLFCVDHHRGSVEQQPGQAYFDPQLYDATTGRFTTLETLARTIKTAGLEDWVLPVVGRSAVVGKYWAPRSLGLVFVDGGHSDEDVQTDYQTWAPRVMPGGYLCFHDLFSDPAQGGQAPFRVFEAARRERTWRYCGQVKTLGVLRRR